jgi:hypothetical protein
MVFFVITTIFIKAEIKATEGLLLETQDFAVSIENLPKLDKTQAYDPLEIKVALYLFIQNLVSNQPQTQAELLDSKVQPHEIVSINFAKNDVHTYTYLLKIMKLMN